MRRELAGLDDVTVTGACRQWMAGEEEALTLLRVMWFIVGSVALALAVVGILLPVLPTTPFVLLSVFAYGKCAPRFAASLERSRFFGATLANWRTHGAIARRHKALAVFMMASVFGVSLLMAVATPVLVLQAVCMTAAAAFILSRPSGAPR